MRKWEDCKILVEDEDYDDEEYLSLGELIKHILVKNLKLE